MDGTLGLSALVGLVLVALAFDFLNGLHDAANSIATVVSTRVLRPHYAVIWAAFFNFIAFLFFGLHVAQTVGTGIVAAEVVDAAVIFGALMGAICWNLLTWWLGIPSSSSHALIGGLVGAAIAKGGAEMVTWSGLVNKVLIPLVGSPIVGFIVAFLLMTAIGLVFAHRNAKKTGTAFRNLQLVSSAAMAFSHGSNDAQKAMGIITLALVANGVLDKPEVPLWVGAPLPFLGVRAESDVARTVARRWPAAVVPDDRGEAAFALEGGTVPAVELVATLLRWVRHRAEELTSHQAGRVVLSVPVAFNAVQRERLREAAGLRVALVAATVAVASAFVVPAGLPVLLGLLGLLAVGSAR